MLSSYRTATLSMKVKLISTDDGASLPAKDGRAEILNSSLMKYPETLCARFLTHQFYTHSDGWPYLMDIINFRAVLLPDLVINITRQTFALGSHDLQIDLIF